jgi:hypothetical protein
MIRDVVVLVWLAIVLLAFFGASLNVPLPSGMLRVVYALFLMGSIVALSQQLLRKKERNENHHVE